MSGTFIVTELAGHRALVTGDGNQKCILDTTERDDLRTMMGHRETDELFQADVQSFFEPLTKAAELHDARHEAIAAQFDLTADPAFVVVIEDEVEPVEGRPAERVILGHDSVVLRLIDSGRTDRLVWVGDDRIEITAFPQARAEADLDRDIDDEMREALADLFGNLAASFAEAEDGDVEPKQSEDGDVEPKQDPLPDEDEDDDTDEDGDVTR